MAFALGLPSVWDNYLLTIVLLLIPIITFLPVFVRYRRLSKSAAGDTGIRLGLFKRCMCVLLSYVMLLSPVVLEALAQSSITNFNILDISTWGADNTTITYAYDLNGSLTSKTTEVTGGNTTEAIAYEYNLQNRLKKVTTTPYLAGSPTTPILMTSYKYDSQGIRIEKNVDGTVTDYLIDPYNHTGYAQVLEETTAGVRTTYTIGDDIISQFTTGGTTQYLLYDGHGSTRQLIDNSSNPAIVIDTYNYDGYGVMLTDDSPTTPLTNNLYAGEQYDSNLSMYYNRARYYNPSNGTFNRVDPYAGNSQDPQSLHKYLYCHNNPINATDPSGLFSFVELVLVAALIGSLTALVAGTVVQIKGGTTRQIIEAQWKWFWIGAGAGALVYGVVWISSAVLVAMYGAGAGLGGLKYAEQYGINTYNNLIEAVKGTGLFKHHIIPQRFAKELGLKAGNMLCIVVDKLEHLPFTNAWQNVIPYTSGNYTGITAQELWMHAQVIYAEYPALLDAAKAQLGI